MWPKNVRVLKRQACRFDPSSEDLLRVLIKVLVERVAPGNVHRQRRLLTTPRPAPLLPDRSDTPRISAAHNRVQSTHIHPKLQGIRRDHTQEISPEETPLNLPSLPHSVTGTIRRDAACETGTEAVGGVAVDELCRLATLGEGDGAYTLRDQVREHEGSLSKHAPSITLLFVLQGRVSENYPPLPT